MDNRMRQRLVWSVGAVLALVWIAICVNVSGFVLGPSLRANVRESGIRGAQEELAKELGVRIQDYPPQTDFPTSYFVTILKPGATLGEVHDVIRGYKTAFRCGGDVEMYDFFDTGPGRFRIEVRYVQGRYVEILDEDAYVPNLDATDCVEGRLGA